MRRHNLHREGESARSGSRRQGGGGSARTADAHDRRAGFDTAERATAGSVQPARRAGDAVRRLFADDARQPPVTDDPRLEREADRTAARATPTAISRRLAATGARLLAGPDAARTADRLDARAFTIGRDIGFARGAFAPGTPAGRRLVAHELAHVDQQTAGRAVGVQRQAVEEPEEQPTETPESTETSPSKSASESPKQQAEGKPASERTEQAAEGKSASEAKPKAGSEDTKSTEPARSGPAALGAFDAETRKRVRVNTDVLAGEDRLDVAAALEEPESLGNADVRVSGTEDPTLRSVLSKAGVVAVQKNLLGPDETLTLAIDLTPVKKQVSGYSGPTRLVVRFSRVGTEDRSTVTVENLGTPDASVRKQMRTAGKAVAEKRGFRLTGFGASGKAAVHEALGMLPASVLDRLSKGSTPLTFRRASVSKSDPKTGGHYVQESHTVVLFDNAFKSSQRRYGESGRFVTETVRMIAHEIGHAVESTEPRVAREADADSTKKTKQERKEATSETGWRWKIVEEEGKRLWDYQHATKDTAFTEALQADATRPAKDEPKGIVSITEYPTKYDETGDQLREMYAESFSLYVTDPETLKRLRPSVYDYFETRYGSSSKGSKSGGGSNRSGRSGRFGRWRRGP
jgi:hypothetical protein